MSDGPNKKIIAGVAIAPQTAPIGISFLGSSLSHLARNPNRLRVETTFFFGWINTATANNGIEVANNRAQLVA
jgi:hypothetical protein